MSAEFVDTNILIYAHDGGAGEKHARSVDLFERLFAERAGMLSTQVLSEFYAAATRKLGMKSSEAEDVIRDLAGWTLHRPGHADVLRAVELQRKHKISWWDALIVNSALELDCTVLWTEEMADGQKFSNLRVRNPFR